MDWKYLPVFVLTILLVGLVIGVGVLTIDKFGSATGIEETITNESITMALLDANVTFANTNLTSFTALKNGSGDTINSANYTITLASGNLHFTGTNDSGCAEGDTCYVDYKWRNYNNPANAVSQTNFIEISNISSNWLGLIVTIAIMSIILALVLGSFITRRYQ